MESIGGLEGIRTLDPYNANVVRSQLRYKPVRFTYDYIPFSSFVKQSVSSDFFLFFWNEM